jgi:hypothetical protein
MMLKCHPLILEIALQERSKRFDQNQTPFAESQKALSASSQRRRWGLLEDLLQREIQTAERLILGKDAIFSPGQAGFEKKLKGEID